ncbi:MAG TPA: MYXO-CTERM sorting domain-containing protein, partial [Polyangia bacterium]
SGGRGGTSAGGGRGGGSAGSSGGGDSGCGCATSGPSNAMSGGASLFVLGMLVISRRRRRR